MLHEAYELPVALAVFTIEEQLLSANMIQHSSVESE